jgi:hypothetical protein
MFMVVINKIAGLSPRLTWFILRYRLAHVLRVGFEPTMPRLAPCTCPTKLYRRTLVCKQIGDAPMKAHHPNEKELKQLFSNRCE